MLSQVGLRYQALLLILLDTGLRIGDALRLRGTDLRRSQDGQPYFEVAINLGSYTQPGPWESTTPVEPASASKGGGLAEPCDSH